MTMKLEIILRCVDFWVRRSVKTGAILFRSKRVFPLSVWANFRHEFQIFTHKFTHLSISVFLELTSSKLWFQLILWCAFLLSTLVMLWPKISRLLFLLQVAIATDMLCRPPAPTHLISSSLCACARDSRLRHQMWIWGRKNWVIHPPPINRPGGRLLASNSEHLN